MSTNKPGTVGASLPSALRTRVNPGWTIHRDMIAAADAAALEAGAPSTSAWVERVVAAAAGIEPPAPPERGRKKK